MVLIKLFSKKKSVAKEPAWKTLWHQEERSEDLTDRANHYFDDCGASQYITPKIDTNLLERFLQRSGKDGERDYYLLEKLRTKFLDCLPMAAIAVTSYDVRELDLELVIKHRFSDRKLRVIWCEQTEERFYWNYQILPNDDRPEFLGFTKTSKLIMETMWYFTPESELRS